MTEIDSLHSNSDSVRKKIRLLVYVDCRVSCVVWRVACARARLILYSESLSRRVKSEERSSHFISISQSPAQPTLVCRRTELSLRAKTRQDKHNKNSTIRTVNLHDNEVFFFSKVQLDRSKHTSPQVALAGI